MSVGLLLPLACEKGESTGPGDATPTNAESTSEPSATLVPNAEAQPGDTTTCPFSGRSFVVNEDHPRVEYEGKQYWICSEKAAESVRADPAKYLDGFEG